MAPPVLDVDSVGDLEADDLAIQGELQHLRRLGSSLVGRSPSAGIRPSVFRSVRLTLGSLRPKERSRDSRICRSKENTLEVKFYWLRNLNGIIVNIMHDKYHFSTYIALVLDLPVPVEVVDGVGNDGGDPGDSLEALDALGVGETLPIVGWIEKKESISSDFVH